MKNFLITIILFSVVSQMKSQCSPPGADRCADAEILCSGRIKLSDSRVQQSDRLQTTLFRWRRIHQYKLVGVCGLQRSDMYYGNYHILCKQQRNSVWSV